MSSLQRSLLLISSSKVHGHEFLGHAVDDINSLLKTASVKKVLFVPYALDNHDDYTARVTKPFSEWGFSLEGIHKAKDPITAVNEAEAIFIGGEHSKEYTEKGEFISHTHTHVSVQATKPTWWRAHSVVRTETARRVEGQDGVPYIGSSAGTNVATVNICTTNDMPIVYPPSFSALGLVHIQYQPTLLGPRPSLYAQRGEYDHSHHLMEETREERIHQYHELPDTPPVLGLREGCVLKVTGNKAVLTGVIGARLFTAGKTPEEFAVGADVSFLLKEN
ncbi:unnamed protein product [Timema podura]|uniref:Uncharacterized protein n=1 Tax=Timema podura TaxID=61482 RepID=A0ABN7P1A9_TIMPD|nr:unnamed protein product [Timema podura]